MPPIHPTLETPAHSPQETESRTSSYWKNGFSEDHEYDSEKDSHTNSLLEGHDYYAQDDLESQRQQESQPARLPPGVDSEYDVPTRTKFRFLGIYLAFNLGLTLYNKSVLGKFTFPWLLTAIHAGSASIGCYLLKLRGVFKLTRLGWRANLILVAFSLLFTINIAISNVSLAMVSVPFHQIMRSMCPMFTVLIYWVYYARSYSVKTYLSMTPIILGVGLTTFGDYYFTVYGFTLTLLGVVLAAVKTILSNRLMTGSLALSGLEILLRMSPLAAVQAVLYSLVTGEWSSFVKYVEAGNLTTFTCIALAGNGVLALLLNICSFRTNKLAGALTISTCGNVKQCLTVLLGVVFFGVKVGPLNGVGMIIALAGAACYSKVELDSNR